LGITREIIETDSLRFYRKLQKYVDSNEKTEKVAPGEKIPPKEMEYWPLIKVVKLVKQFLEILSQMLIKV